MKQSPTTKNRKELENKMAFVFENDIKSLPVELRKIMVDDLVSAFESRFFALSRAQSNSEFLRVIEGEVCFETQ